jgi:hypothetical protein
MELTEAIFQQAPSYIEDYDKMVKFKRKGASSWLSSVPLKSFGFMLNKQEFTDAIALRYNFTIKDLARKCVCGEANTINHALSCKRGGYVSLRHNSLRDMIAELLNFYALPDAKMAPLNLHYLL